MQVTWSCSHSCSRWAGRSERKGACVGRYLSPLSGPRKSNAHWKSSWQQFSSDQSAALLQFVTKKFGYITEFYSH